MADAALALEGAGSDAAQYGREGNHGILLDSRSVPIPGITCFRKGVLGEVAVGEGNDTSSEECSDLAL